eukprot:403372381
MLGGVIVLAILLLKIRHSEKSLLQEIKEANGIHLIEDDVFDSLMNEDDEINFGFQKKGNVKVNNFLSQKSQNTNSILLPIQKIPSSKHNASMNMSRNEKIIDKIINFNDNSSLNYMLDHLLVILNLRDLERQSNVNQSVSIDKTTKSFRRSSWFNELLELDKKYKLEAFVGKAIDIIDDQSHPNNKIVSQILDVLDQFKEELTAVDLKSPNKLFSPLIGKSILKHQSTEDQNFELQNLRVQNQPNLKIGNLDSNSNNISPKLINTNSGFYKDDMASNSPRNFSTMKKIPKISHFATSLNPAHQELMSSQTKNSSLKSNFHQQFMASMRKSTSRGENSNRSNYQQQQPQYQVNIMNLNKQSINSRNPLSTAVLSTQASTGVGNNQGNYQSPYNPIQSTIRNLVRQQLDKKKNSYQVESPLPLLNLRGVSPRQYQNTGNLYLITDYFYQMTHYIDGPEEQIRPFSQNGLFDKISMYANQGGSRQQLQ